MRLDGYCSNNLVKGGVLDFVLVDDRDAFRKASDDLLDLSAVEVEQDGRRALLRTAPRPSIDPICRALAVTLPPVFQEVPTDKVSISVD